MAVPDSEAVTVRDRLRARLAELRGTPVDISLPRRLSGGASRQTWSFDVDGAGMILRRDPPGMPQADRMAREAAALLAARRAGVPVPRVYDHGDSAMGAPYVLMERMEGETIPRRLLRDERFALVRQGLAVELGRILAVIHSIPLDAVPELENGDPLQLLTENYDAIREPRPAFELGLRWLAEHRPGPAEERVVHGDFRNGNLLIGQRGVHGVLDWEAVHRGDPAEDLGWLCVKAWRFGSGQPVGGFGRREDLLKGYAEVAGFCPDLDRLRWWEVYGTLRWGVLCRQQAERHLSGAEPSLELAALGRRVCETEHDLLLILGLSDLQAVTDPLDAELAGESSDCLPPHDRPPAAGLLAAVQDFLGGELRAFGDDRIRFLCLVASNSMRIAQRELLLGEQHRQAHANRLAALGYADDTELSAAIREGSRMDTFDEVVASVRAAVTDKLLVANPGYLAQPR